MSRETFIAVPADLSDPQALHTFLATLVEKLDVVFGNRAESPFVSVESQATQSVVGSYIEASQQTDNSLTAIAERLAKASAVTQINIESSTASVAYVEAELQQVIADLAVIASTVNKLLVTFK